jgi:DNA-binding NarL/FixJ family response regulator
MSGAERLMASLGEAMGFVAGVFWVPEADVLLARVLWHADDVHVPEFEAQTRRLRVRPGVGLPGRAWQRREPVSWLSTADACATRRNEAAVREGLRDAVAIPAIFGDDVLAVVELGSREEAELTERLMRSLSGIGHELGRFLAHRRGELEPPLLTARELEVLQLAARGLSAPQIARRLVISPGTVKTHFENIYPKLRVCDRASAVAQAIRLGLIE